MVQAVPRVAIVVRAMRLGDHVIHLILALGLSKRVGSPHLIRAIILLTNHIMSYG